MNIQYGKFLFARPLKDKECLSGYIARIASDNYASMHFKAILPAGVRSDAALENIVTLTGAPLDILKRRGSQVFEPGQKVVGTRYGNIVLPATEVSNTTPRICPECFEEDYISRCIWEVQQYQLCHVHGTALRSKCTDCGKPFTWQSLYDGQCICGCSPVKLERPSLCREAALTICQTLSDAMDQALCAGHPLDTNRPKPSVLPIDWIIYLSNFVRNYLFEASCKRFQLSPRDFGPFPQESFFATLLSDAAFCRNLVRGPLAKMKRVDAQLKATDALCWGDRVERLRMPPGFVAWAKSCAKSRMLGGQPTHDGTAEHLNHATKSSSANACGTRSMPDGHQIGTSVLKQAGVPQQYKDGTNSARSSGAGTSITRRSTQAAKNRKRVLRENRPRASDPGGITWRPRIRADGTMYKSFVRSAK